MFIINCLPPFPSLSSIILSSPSYSLVPHLPCVTVLYEVCKGVWFSSLPTLLCSSRTLETWYVRMYVCMYVCMCMGGGLKRWGIHAHNTYTHIQQK
jgi:hypothetical protein